MPNINLKNATLLAVLLLAGIAPGVLVAGEGRDPAKKNSLRIAPAVAVEEDEVPVVRERSVPRMAQAPKGPPPGKLPPGLPGPDSPRPAPPSRDPTTVQPDLRPILDPPATAATAGSNVAQFKLRGRVAGFKGKAGGILDVNGQLFMIQEGSTIDTVIGGSTEITVLVKKFSADGVVLEVEQTGKTIRLR